MKLRYAKSADIPKLAQIHSKSLISAFGDFFPEGIVAEKFSIGHRKIGFTKEIAAGEPKSIIAFHMGKPAGLLSYGKSRYLNLPKTTVELWRIYLSPEFQGMGMGKELLEFGLLEMSKNGYSKVILWVLEENTKARRFYEKNGFLHYGVRMDAHYGRDIVDLMYEKSLRPGSRDGNDMLPMKNPALI